MNRHRAGRFGRFTEKMLERSRLDQAHADAARELAEELIRGQVSFMLGHGRDVLQESVPVADRRLLLQLFLRASADSAA